MSKAEVVEMEETKPEPTLAELKAAAYDRLALIERCQLEIKELNQRITAAQEKKES